MEKLAIIVDSFAGRNKEDVEKIPHHFFIPLKVIINGKEYEDGIKDVREIMALTNPVKEVKTSQPSPATFAKYFEDLSTKYENIIYLPVPSCISGTAQSAQVVARDFEKVHVVPSISVGSSFFELAKYLMQMSQENQDIKKIIKFAHEYGNFLPTFVIPKNVQAFLRGGRMGKSLSVIFDKMKIIPIVFMDDLIKLKKKAVKRSGRKAAEYAIDKLIDIMCKKEIKNLNDYQFLITHTLDDSFAKEAVQIFKRKKIDAKIELTSGIINAHTGDGAYSISVYKKFKK